MAVKKIAKKPIKKATKNLGWVDASDDKCFWVCSGMILRNLKDLRAALAEMSDEVFICHLNKDKNDFAKWVEEILLDGELAKGLKKVKTRMQALKKVAERLKKY